MQPKRKSQRKKDYDYSQPGYYSVTICTQRKSCLFGIIQNGEMVVNDAGQMVRNTWYEIPTFYPGGLESKINPHFGQCEKITFVTIENRHIVETNIVTPFGPHSCSILPKLFIENGADTCIVGGIGGRPFMLLQEYGIKIYSVGRDIFDKLVKEIIHHFIQKQLPELRSSSCQNH